MSHTNRQVALLAQSLKVKTQSYSIKLIDCFAALAMTTGVVLAPLEQYIQSFQEENMFFLLQKSQSGNGLNRYVLGF